MFAFNDESIYNRISNIVKALTGQISEEFVEMSLEELTEKFLEVFKEKFY